MARTIPNAYLLQRVWKIAMVIALLLAAWSPASAQFPRRVLIEEFTSATCTPCVQATPILNDIVNMYQGKVVTIRYHVNLPVGGDPWYDASFIEPAKAKYGVSGSNGPPKAFIDSEWPVNPLDKSAIKDIVDQQLAAEGGTSPVKIDVTQTVEGGNLKIHIVATAGPSGVIAEDGYKLRVFVIESHIHVDNLEIPAYNHETDFYDVPRAVVPSFAGTAISLNPNQAKTYDYTVPIGSTWQADKMFTVAFLQTETGSGVPGIMQMGNSPRPTSGVDYASAPLAGYALAQSTPNPASGTATIGYSIGAAERVAIELHNTVGDRVATFDQGAMEAGEHRASVDVSNLPAGIYTYTITAGTWRATRTLTVVR